MKDVYGESKLVFALNEVDFYVLDLYSPHALNYRNHCIHV